MIVKDSEAALAGEEFAAGVNVELWEDLQNLKNDTEKRKIRNRQQKGVFFF
jgi:glycerol kinase